MEVLELLKRALKTCAGILRFGASLQEPARKELTADLQRICLNCEDAYSTVLKRLGPVKDAFHDPDRLAKELRDFAGDTQTRDAFKPEHLCGEIDHLIVRLESNLDPLKYSVDFSRLGEIRRNISLVGNYDLAIYSAYDDFARQLDDLATQFHDPASDANERALYARHVVTGFESDLRSAIDGIREAKQTILLGV